MTFLKKQSVGFYATALAVLLAAAGLGMYLKNCATDYFRNLGKDPLILGCLVLAIAAQLVLLAAAQRGQKLWMDFLPIAASVLLMLGAIWFVSSRVNGIASIMTFENNANTMADLSSAIAGMALCLAAGIVSIIASFFDITKEGC